MENPTLTIKRYGPSSQWPNSTRRRRAIQPKAISNTKILWEKNSRSKNYGAQELGEGYQKARTSSYKINKFWGCNEQHDDYS